MNIIAFIKATFRNKRLNPSGREVTVFVFVLVVIASWIGQQFFGKAIPQWMFISFISLIAAGIGLYTFEPSKFTTEENKAEINLAEENKEENKKTENGQ